MTAPRWLRALARAGAVLLPQTDPPTGYAVFARGDRRRRPLARVSPAQVDNADKKGWLNWRGEGCVVSDSGRQVAVRGEDGPPPGAAQHRRMIERLVMQPDGKIVVAQANALEGPIGKWARDLAPKEIEAAERFVRDYVRSTLSQPVTRNWSPVSPRRGETRRHSREDAALGAIAAKNRVMNALAALEPVEARVIEAALIREESLAAMERRFGWRRRSAKQVVKAALARLAEIYR